MSSSGAIRSARSARTGNMGARDISGLPSRVQALKHRRNAKKFNALPRRRFATQNIHKSPRIGMVALQPSSSSYFQGVAILGYGGFASFLSGVAALQASISTGRPLIAIRVSEMGELPNWPA